MEIHHPGAGHPIASRAGCPKRPPSSSWLAHLPDSCILGHDSVLICYSEHFPSFKWLSNQIVIETRDSGPDWNLGISVTSKQWPYIWVPSLLSLSPRGIIFLWIFHGVSFLSCWFLGFLSFYTDFLFITSLSLTLASASSTLLSSSFPPPYLLSVNIPWNEETGPRERGEKVEFIG